MKNIRHVTWYAKTQTEAEILRPASIALKKKGQIMGDRYQWLKEHGICVQCGSKDAFGKYVRCAECLEKAENKSRELWNDDAKRIRYNASGNRRKRELRAERKEKHLCMTCGKKLPQKQKETTCERCRNKRNARRRAKTGKTYGDAFRERMDKGVCMYCGKPVVDGYKICQEHLAIRKQALDKNGEARSEKWRKEIENSYKSKKI